MDKDVLLFRQLPLVAIALERVLTLEVARNVGQVLGCDGLLARGRDQVRKPMEKYATDQRRALFPRLKPTQNKIRYKFGTTSPLEDISRRACHTNFLSNRAKVGRQLTGRADRQSTCRTSANAVIEW